MDSKKIKRILFDRDIKVDDVLEKLKAEGVKMERSAWFRRMRGETEFTHNEVIALTKALDLEKDEVFDIFFSN